MDGDYSSFAPSQTQTSSPGATVEVAKRPKGRPKGSKNKPKVARPLGFVPRDDMMAPFILEVPHGNNVVRAISQFSVRKNTGLCVLNASGTVANASLCLYPAASAPEITCPGHHVILSMSATFGPRHCPTSNLSPKPLTASLAAPNGHVIGGFVFGSLVSVGPVFVIATSFNRPSYHKLSYEDEGSVRNTATGEGEGGYAPSPLPGGIPMQGDRLTIVQGPWASMIRPPQPAPSTPPQYFAT